MRRYMNSCSLARMPKSAEPKPYKTFRERVTEAREGVEKIEGVELNQSQLAKAVKASPQAIQHLESKTKEAQGSIYTVQIARRCYVNPYWLATGLGPKEALSDAALQLAGDWMDLDNTMKVKVRDAVEDAKKATNSLNNLKNPVTNKNLIDTVKMQAIKHGKDS